MEEYKPNSHKSKEEQRESDALPEKKVGKVITGSAKSKKKGEMQKFADVFISEDVGNVKSYIIMVKQDVPRKTRQHPRYLTENSMTGILTGGGIIVQRGRGTGMITTTLYLKPVGTLTQFSML